MKRVPVSERLQENAKVPETEESAAWDAAAGARDREWGAEPPYEPTETGTYATGTDAYTEPAYRYEDGTSTVAGRPSNEVTEGTGDFADAPEDDDEYRSLGPDDARSTAARTAQTQPTEPSSLYEDTGLPPSPYHGDEESSTNTYEGDGAYARGATDKDLEKHGAGYETYTRTPRAAVPMPVPQYDEPSILTRLSLMMHQTFSDLVTGISMLVVANMAVLWLTNPLRKRLPRARTDPEYEQRITGERLSERVEYYCEFWGYSCEAHEIVTKEGWILRAHRISDPRRPGGRGYPVVLQHGILCNSLFWFTTEERSLGFWLVDRGFDVWATNIRGNYNMGHTHYARWDPRFWAWSIEQLALDLNDVVDYILQVTGYRQLAYVGHSQGVATMAVALSNGMTPELGYKLSSFSALGPAIYCGAALHRFPFSVFSMFKTHALWTFAFGRRDFFPVIHLMRQVLPAWWFGHLALCIFGFIFRFDAHNWLPRQVPKVFRSVGVQTSAELLNFYMNTFTRTNCMFNTNMREPWFPPSFPPLTVIYGTHDDLVLGKPFEERLMRYESNVEIVHMVALYQYQHMDMCYGVEAFKTSFPRILDTIQRTRDLEDMPVTK